MRTTTRYLILAGAALALVAGAVAAPVLAQGRHGGRGMDLIDTYDANGDGRLTQQEIDGARRQQLDRFDRDRNGRLALEEYQALWAEAMRESMVRRFQRHDRDGDGAVTAAEYQERFEGMVREHDRNGDGAVTADELRGGHSGHRGEGRGRDGDRNPG